MEQLNSVPSGASEETQQPAATAALENKGEATLLMKVRAKFGIFGLISLVFGGFFALGFYKAYLGVNVAIFTLVIVGLLNMIMRRLSIPMKTGTKAYYAGAILLGVSTTFTANESLQLLNIIGILFLLDLSLLHQFYEDRSWDFTKYLLNMFGLLFASIASFGRPFIDNVDYLKHAKILKNDKVRNILLGTIIALPLLLILTALLSAADLLFGKMTQNIYEFVFSSDIIAVVFMVLLGFLACYCIICGAVSGVGKSERREIMKADTSIAATFMTLISLIYAVFCGIQIVYLFANGVFNLPAEFTFAEYARRGFFELLAVTVINIILILFCTKLFEESRYLRGVLTFMTACTFIMIISATYRMLLYIGAYHLTFLRLFVLLALLIDTLVLAGVIVSVYRKSFPLFPYCVAVISACYIAFSFAKPDYFIAGYLIAQKEVLEERDIIYMTDELSVDAASVVLPILTENNWKSNTTKIEDEYELREYYYTVEEYIKMYYDEIEHNAVQRGIRDFNYSYDMADRYLEKYK